MAREDLDIAGDLIRREGDELGDDVVIGLGEIGIG